MNFLTELQKALYKLQDLPYREFTAKLIPNIEKESIIGIRTPALRAFAKEFAKSPEAKEFLCALPHTYYEENNLHAFLIAQIKDAQQALTAIEEFLPCIDNWATCDGLRPKCFAKDPTVLLPSIARWLESNEPYTIRFAVNMLMVHFLGTHFDPAHMELLSTIRHDDYYVKMVIAWYFAEALAKQYDAAIAVLQENRLDPWTHNKAIQKAIESRKISNETKAYLRTLKG